ncbi:MAG: DMT family transporter [Candidatus Aminicenantales bacterium]
MKSSKSLFEIHAAVLLFGLSGLFGKWISLSPFLIVFGRVMFACLSLALLLVLRKQKFTIRDRKDYLLFFFLGFILASHWVSFFRSIQVSTVAIGLFSYSSFPVFTAFLEPLFFKEKFDRLNILFAFVCLFGVFLIIPRLDIGHSTTEGVLWGLVSGLTFALLSIFNRKLSLKYSSLIIAFFQDFFAALLLLPFFIYLQPRPDIRNLALLLFLGVVCTAGSHTLFIKGMRQIKAQTASLISTLEPVYGILLAFLLLHEVPSLRTILGGLVILGAVLILSVRTASTAVDKIRSY